MDTATVLDHIEATLDPARERWFDFLRIPSVSAQPAHAADCHRAAEWIRDQLAGLGFRPASTPQPGNRWSWPTIPAPAG